MIVGFLSKIAGSFVSRDAVFSLMFIIIGFGAGWIVKGDIFPDKCPTCPDCICPDCPPQTVNIFSITNEKIKAKGGSSIDLSSIIKDNLVLNKIDSVQKASDTLKSTATKKKRGWFGKLFTKD
jgi:hypothetical protein